jgi:hypothetical protein
MKQGVRILYIHGQMLPYCAWQQAREALVDQGIGLECCTQAQDSLTRLRPELVVAELNHSQPPFAVTLAAMGQVAVDRVDAWNLAWRRPL